MATEWNVKCKRCGHDMGYSDRSYRNSLQYGHSRPEYCDECQGLHHQEKANMGAPYFRVSIGGKIVNPSEFGGLKRTPRKHEMEEKEGDFDETRYGLTQEKIREIAAWFANHNHRVAVVVGPTGSGKSTALPYWLIYPPEGVPEDFFTKDGQILVTQPRILATTKIAKHLGADLMGATIGKAYDVGYRFSKERKASLRNVIQYCTDGILVNEITKGSLSQYGIIVLDEAHERSLNIDQILRLLKERMMLHPRLRLIIASATIDAKSFLEFFGETATLVEFEGKRVDEHGKEVSYQRFFADPEETLPYDDLRLLRRELGSAVTDKVMWILGDIEEGQKPKGDILVFLQGVKPINEAVEKIRGRVKHDATLANLVEVFPLYRELPEDEKDRATTPSKQGKIHVIVSTNIAEASVTIEDLAYEVETGVENQAVFNKDANVTEIRLNLISRSNARQRWGRTGRTKNGEVYCLYTEEQFRTLFPEFPKPEIQRGSMEEVLLTTKAAGIVNPVEGWLQNPMPGEVGRSLSVLKNSGAISSKGLLTEYGLLLRSFSYPSKLVDLLLLADDWGCAVELATILPVIKNGGQRRILAWEHDWDVYTKRDAARVHRALMAGCLDDVEFILKICKAWGELPWLNQDELKHADMPELRASWAKQQFVDHRVLGEIANERDAVLSRLFSHKKAQVGVYPPINLALIDRVRILLVMTLPEIKRHGLIASYRYETNPEPISGSLVTCEVFVPSKWQKELHSSADWMRDTKTLSSLEQASRSEVFSRDPFSRLFVEQVYPLGSKFDAIVGEGSIQLVSGSFASLVKTGQIQKKERFIEAINAPVTEELLIDPEKEIERAVEEGEESNEGQPLKQLRPEIALNSIGSVYERVNGTLWVNTSGKSIKRGDVLKVEVGDYNFSDQIPMVLTNIVPQPEPFDVFAHTYRYGDDIEVKVTELLSFDNDYTVALVVCEKKTQMEILVEPSDIGFTTSSSIVRKVPIDAKLKMKVEVINPSTGRVRLSMLSLAEQTITNDLLSDSGREEEKIVTGTVVEIRRDTVFFALEWGKPQEGRSVIVSTYSRKLLKPAAEYTLNESARLRVGRSNWSRFETELQDLPKKAAKSVSKTEPRHGLYWTGELLCHTGRMTYDELFDYKSYASDTAYHRALERLYWLCNRLLVIKVMDDTWMKRVQTEYPIGSQHDSGVVKSLTPSGAIIELPGNVHGFAPRSKILNGKENPTKLLKIGGLVSVSVSEVRVDKEELLLSVDQLADDPLTRLKEGEVVGGIVKGITDVGFFIELAPGVKGLLRREQVGEGITYQRGDRVMVKIYSIDPENRRISLDLATSEGVEADEDAEGFDVDDDFEDEDEYNDEEDDTEGGYSIYPSRPGIRPK